MTAPIDRPEGQGTTAPRSPRFGRTLQSIFPIFAIVFALVFLNKAHEIGFGTTTAEPIVIICVVLPLALLSLATAVRSRRRAAAPSGSAAAAPDAAAGTPEDDDAGTRSDSGTPAGAPAGAAATPDGPALPGVSIPAADSPRAGWLAPTTVVVALALLILATPYLGLLTACGLFLLALMYVFGYRRPVPCLAIAAGMVLFIWLGFERFLAVPLPIGIWGF